MTLRCYMHFSPTTPPFFVLRWRNRGPKPGRVLLKTHFFLPKFLLYVYSVPGSGPTRGSNQTRLPNLWGSYVSMEDRQVTR